MKKLWFLLKNASMTTRIIALVALLLAVMSVGLVCAGANSAINGSLTEIPLLKMVVDETKLEEMEREAKDLSKEIQNVINTNDTAKIQKLEEEYGVSIDKIETAFDPISLNSMKMMSENMNDPSLNIFKFVITLIKGYAAVIVVLLLLAAVFMKKGLMILSYLVSIPFYLIFVGTSPFLLATVALVAYFVLMTIVNRQYKAYKKEKREEKKALREEAAAESAEE